MIEAIFISIIFFGIIFAGAYFSVTKNVNTHKFQKKLQHSHYVLTVRNCEDSIEGIIRSIVWKMMIQSTQFSELIVIDTGSQDKTLSILKKLSEEYDFMHPMEKSEYIRFINQLY